jgi:ubiquinone/menaquinone biosynthesis C-methylase UbiE
LRVYRNPRRKGWDPYDNAHPLLKWYFYRRLDVALSLADISPHHTVVDLGCWMGHLEVTLASMAQRVIAVDRADEVCKEPFFEPRVTGWNCLQIAQEMLSVELGTSVSNCTFVRGDIATLPIASETADGVFCLDTLEHVHDTEAALDEIRRIMKWGAVLIVSFPIELGPALTLRRIAGKATGLPRYGQSILQLIRSLFTGGVASREMRGDHVGYDWHSDLEHIKSAFEVEATRFVPIEQLRTINPTVVVRARKLR